MNERPPTLRPTLSKEIAQEMVSSFTNHFKWQEPEAHLYLAYHAAFPLTLTPDLLYRLRANFSHYKDGESFNVPWIAVADLLLSDLCKEMRRGLYEMDVAVRNVLLEELRAHPRFGKTRFRELSDFMFAYMQQQLYDLQPFHKDSDRVFRWTALAYTEPREAARELAEALRISLEQNDTDEQIRLSALIETFAEPFADEGLVPLLTYAYRIARFARVDEETTEALRDTEDTSQELRRTRSLQISLPTLAQIQKDKKKSEAQAEPATSTTEPPLIETGETLILAKSRQSTQADIPPPADTKVGSWYSDYAIELYKQARPRRKGICPSCSNEISFGDCRIVSGHTPDKVLKRVPTDWWERRLANLNPEPLYTSDYQHEQAQRECPKCGYHLPYNIELVDNTITLAVIGDTFSGKSHYIASLLHQMEKEWLPQVAQTGPVSFTGLTPQVEELYKEKLLEPLFIQKRSLHPTIPNIEENQKPLIYELIMGTSTTNLIFYDTSGEHFEQSEGIVRFARYIFNANAFIFVIDPVKIPYVFQRFPPDLQKLLQPQFDLVRQRRAADMIHSTLTFYERYHGYPEGEGPYPLTAIMVSKSDLLESITTQSYTFTKRPVYGSGANIRDLAIVNQEVKGLLKEYQQGDLLNTTNRLEYSYFFATSATGEQPDEQGKLTHVEPRRCLDPFLWILYRLHIIQAHE